MKRIVLFLITAASLLSALAVSANPPTPVAYVSNQNGGVTIIDAQRYRTLKVLPGFKLPWGVVTYPKAYGSLDAP